MEFDWYLYLPGVAPDFPPHQCLLDMWESSIARDVLTIAGSKLISIEV